MTIQLRDAGAVCGTAGKALNIFTRVDVETGDNVGIGGFIITGTDAKLVVLRAIGPSLADAGVPGELSDRFHQRQLDR